MGALLTAGALILAGCGGDGDGGGGGSATAPAKPRSAGSPTAKGPISAEVGPFNRALAARDCREYEPLVFSIVRDQLRPGAPATAAECRDRNSAFDRYRFSRAREYGTAAVMEGPAEGKIRKQGLWALDRDGRFRFTEVAGVSLAQIGSRFTQAAEAERVASRFLRAVRERDCAAVRSVLSSQARLVVNLRSAHAACKAVLDGKFLAPSLRETPEIRAEVMGGTRDLAFVGVPTRRAWFTMLLSDSGAPGMRVLDILPGPLPR